MRQGGGWFFDEAGRRLLLRGVNLGGSSKVPAVPDGASHRPESLVNDRGVSFVGRPFPLEEADQHFRRLRSWGFTFLRFLVTWEAIEHLGPGAYDDDYLDYVESVLRRAGEHGFTVLIDPHQDVWSRFTGGDGAPGWTLEAVGFDIEALHESGACVRHQEWGDPFPWLIWSTNGSRLASATMWTLFLAGDVLAPATLLEGESAQQFLQRHYIAAIRQVAQLTRGMDHVIGYELINEPSRGWIGVPDVRRPCGVFRKGPAPTPWQSIVAGAGHPVGVAAYTTGDRLVFRRGPDVVINPGGRSAWLPGEDCVWRANGVWEEEAGRPVLRRPGHFAGAGPFTRDCLLPFAGRYIDAIREVDPKALLFFETLTEGDDFELGPGAPEGLVYAPHWYDGMTMLTRKRRPRMAIDVSRRRPVFGRLAVRRSLDEQLLRERRFARRRLRDVPVIFGETGVPFGLNNGYCFITGDFRLEEWALDRVLRAFERTLSSVVLWNYTADNSNARGDQWNGEDFSLFSPDQISSLGPYVQLPVEFQKLERAPRHPSAGGRALRAVVRPYPLATAGEPLELAYDMSGRTLLFRFRHDPVVTSPTEVFVPSLYYWDGFEVAVSDGDWEYDEEQQVLIWRHDPGTEEHVLRLRPKAQPLRPSPGVGLGGIGDTPGDAGGAPR